MAGHDSRSLGILAATVVISASGCASHGRGSLQQPTVIPAMTGVGALQIENDHVLVLRSSLSYYFLKKGGSDNLFEGPLRLRSGESFSQLPFGFPLEAGKCTLRAIRDGVTIWDFHSTRPGIFGLDFHHYDTIAVKPYDYRLAEAVVFCLTSKVQSARLPE